MGITNWWALGTLAFIPAILLLYILKQKAKEYNISSLYLWRETYKSLVATTWWERLKNNLLMYLQLLIMCLLILALGGLYFNLGKSTASHVILVFDTSGSMNSNYEETTRLEAAKNNALDYVNQLVESCTVTIVTCSNTPKVELTNSTNRQEIISSIVNVEGTDLAGTLDIASEFLESLTSELKEYEVVMFTDADVSLAIANTTLVDLSNTGNNLSIDYVSYGLQEDSMTVLAKVSNRGVDSMQSDVNLYMGQQLFDIKAITLEPGESDILYFDPVEKGTFGEAWPEYLKAELNEKDAVRGDNTAYDVIREGGTPNVLLVTAQNIFLEKAINACAEVELYKTNNTALASNSEPFDLYIYDGIIPDSWPEKGNILILNPPRSVYMEELSGASYNELKKGDTATSYDSSKHLFYLEDSENGVYIKTNEHELNAYFSEYQFGVNKLQLMEEPIWANSFLEYSTYSAGFLGVFEGRVIGVLGFDLHDSELPLQAEFPILMGQLLSECVQNQRIQEEKITTGESITLHVDSQVSNITVENRNVESPMAKEIISPSNIETMYTNTNTTGIYSFTFDGEEPGIAYVGVNYPTNSESDMTKGKAVLKTNQEQGEVVASNVIRKGIDMKRVLLGVVFVLLTLEWFIACKRSS